MRSSTRRGPRLTGLATMLSLSLFLACGADEPTTDPAALPTEATSEPASPAPADGPSLEPAVGGVTWRAGEPLVYVRPDNPMRVAEYAVRDHEDATLAVSHFALDEGGGGQVQANIDRWLGQFEQPGGGSSAEASQTTVREVHGLRVTTVDVSGRFVGRLGMGGPGEARDGWRLLGAIIEGPAGLVFFKLLGPADAVASAADAFEAMVASVQRD